MAESNTSLTAMSGIERAIDILNLFLRPGVTDLGVTEISEQLGLSKAVVHRVLTSFRSKDYLSVDPATRRYRLGPQALMLGLTYLDRLDPQELVRAELRGLSERTEETATMSIVSGGMRTYIAQVTPNRSIKMVVELGVPYPLHAGASSKALLAFMPTEVRDAYLAEKLTRVTDRTVVSARKLARELAEIRERGYAVTFGERQPGAGSVAAPVLDHTGVPVASVSVCGPEERFAEHVDECVEQLLAVTAEVSRQLGHVAS